jgi:hypothetical protein
LLAHLKNLTTTGAEAGTGIMKNLPTIFTNYLNANLETRTILALSSSRDI